MTVVRVSDVRPDPPPRAASAPALDSAELRYVGLVTRGIAFALDAAIVNLVALVVAAGAALIISVLHLPSVLKTVIEVVGGASYILWSIAYFVGFWSTTGQTPGSRAMEFRVMTTRGGTLKPRRALVRVAGLVLAALPLFAGYVLILFDDRRRGLQDRIACTVVVETGAPGGRSTGRSARLSDRR